MATRPPMRPTTDQEMIDGNPALQSALNRGGVDPEVRPAPKQPKSYQVVGKDTKIPVSKSYGKMVQGRIKAAQAARRTSGIEDAWREAIRYYDNDQMGHRDGDTENSSGNDGLAKRINRAWTETENVVFANTSTMLPVLYAKNPQAEFTATNEENREFATIMEDYINAIVALKPPRGVGLKSKARRAVLVALLTNSAWIEVGYTFKDNATETVITELNQLATEWKNAKTTKDIETVEGKIQALEDTIELTKPAGCWVKLVSPFNIYVDPDGEEHDLSDANWLAKVDFLPTAFVCAKYLTEKDKKQYALLFEPTHVLRANNDPNNGLDEEINSFSLFNKDTDDKKKFGYDSDEAYEKAKMTKVWYYWDRTTKRLFLFHDKDWKWPLWVWDDPYKLSGFFPFHKLSFHESPTGGFAKGEVTYYLDQQDAINEINDSERRARLNVKHNILFNQDVLTREMVEEVLKGPDGTARGISMGEDGDKKLSDHLFTWSPEFGKHPELFQNSVERKLQAIARISSVNSVLAGQEFKTNTTNKAVDSYQMSAEIRVDEKTDMIEDWLGDICMSLAEMTVMYTDAVKVGNVIGQSVSEQWQNLSPQEMHIKLSMRIIGGSTDKPTSKLKKKEAVELGQVLGQFVQASPVVVLVMLKVFEQAFDEVVMTDELWKMVVQSVEQSLAQKEGEGAPPEGAEGAPPEGDDAARSNIMKAINTLPPEAKQQLEQMVQSGMKPSEALRTVMQQLQGGGGGPPQGGPPPNGGAPPMPPPAGTA